MKEEFEITQRESKDIAAEAIHLFAEAMSLFDWPDIVYFGS
jgi:hypothetical protein